MNFMDYVKSVTHNKPLDSFNIEGGRCSNFEMLRIVCMLMIICGHIMQLHSYSQLYDLSWYINQICFPFCIVAVDVFIVISGYFSINMNSKKLWSMNWMVTFYSVIILFVSLYIGLKSFEPRKDWMAFLPVLTKQYWFITDYVVLCLISPFLNLLVESLDRDHFKRFLVISFAVFCVVPTCARILNFKDVANDAGMGLINFIFLYFIGRFIKLHYKTFYHKWIYLSAFVLCMASLAVFQILYSYILGFDFTALYSYDTLFCVVGAISLFLYFKNLTFSNRFINLLAKPCLSVYVMHFNNLFFALIFTDLLKIQELYGYTYILSLFIVPVTVYIACSIIELSRRYLFNQLHIS